MHTSAREILNVALDIVFPRCCLLCRAPIEDQHTHLCPSCRKLLRDEMARPACPRCAHSIGPYGIHDGRCHACRDSGSQLDHLVRVGPYGHAMAALVRAFKYGGHDELDRYLADLLAEVVMLAPWFASVDVLVCVPTHWRHSIRRPLYAPAILARALSRKVRVRLLPVLRRVSAGPHQFDVPRWQRRANIRGRFGMTPGARVGGARLCLVDDVSTTGATLDECAGVLTNAGAAAVYGAVIAKVDTNVQQSRCA